MPICRKCGSERETGTRCKPCLVAYKHAWYESNKERLAPVYSQYQKDHRKQCNDAVKRHYYSNHDDSKSRARTLAADRKESGYWKEYWEKRFSGEGGDLEKSAFYKKKYLNDRVYILSRQKALYALDKSVFSARGRIWRQENPDKVVAKSQRYRASKMRAFGVHYTSDEYDALCAIQSEKCAHCGEGKQRLTVDHIVALSLGGSNSMENIQLLCLSCNCRKHAAPHPRGDVELVIDLRMLALGG